MAGWLNPNDPNSGAELLTQEQIARQQEIAAKMLAAAGKARPMTSPWQAVAQAAEGAFAGLRQRDANLASAATADWNKNALTGDLGVAAPAVTAAPVVAGGTAEPVVAAGAVPGVAPDIKSGIVQTASALGIDPVDLATTISYETGGTFDPTKRGPTTKWGQHRGLIQFGEPQAKEHGVDWANPVGSQLGPNGAVASYLKKAGVQPGMGLLDIYSAINAGAPGLYNRSDAAAGGAPGTVRDKVEKQMQGHRAKAMALLAENAADLPAEGATPVAMDTGNQGFAIPGEDPAKLRADAEYYAKTNPEAARQLLARADAAEAASAPVAPQAPPMPMPVAAGPAQPAPPMNGNTFNSIQAGGMEPVFQSEGVSQPWMNTAIPPAASPAARVAQAMQSAPMPPPRPPDLATAPADLPAPGAVPAIGQMPPVAPRMPDYTSMDNAGARPFAVAEGERRLGQAPAPMAGPTASMPVAQASLPAAAPVAPPAPVERVAQAVAAAQAGAPASAAPASPAVQGVAGALAGVNPRVLAAATSPYSSPQTKAVAQVLLKQQLEAAEKNRPDAVEARKLDLALKQKQLSGDPTVQEGQRLDNEAKRRNLTKPIEPVTKVLKRPDGSEFLAEYRDGKWLPADIEGGASPAPTNPYALTGKTTEDQGKSAGFANRMVESHNILNQLEGVGLDKTQATLGSVPIIGNSLSSGDKQKFEQAKRNFVTSILRKESGAAISAGEFDTEEKKYFPQVGDKPEVVEQKRQARETAIQSVMSAAGPGYKVPDAFKPGAKPATGAAPKGVDEKVWKHMTPEERALWN